MGERVKRGMMSNCVVSLLLQERYSTVEVVFCLEEQTIGRFDVERKHQKKRCDWMGEGWNWRMVWMLD